MKIEDAFYAAMTVANTATTAAAGWNSLAELLLQWTGVSVREFTSAEIDQDIQQLQRSLRQTIQEEPIPSEIDALYFGLFDAIDEERNEVIGYYVSGIAHYNPDIPDTMVRSAWWPENRYLESKLLSEIKRAELKARESLDPEVAELLGYASQIGCAALVSRFVVGEMSLGLQTIVGFDSGDYAELAA